MLLVRLLLALISATILLTATPALPDTHEPMQAVAQSVGADVLVDHYPSDRINAGFLAAGTYCSWVFCVEVPRSTIIFFGDWSGVPYAIREAVMLHELGHYRQWAENRRADEWDADLYAANTLCARGRDGVDIMRRVAMFFIERIGMTWGQGHSDVHGSWYERVENVRAHASACRRESSAP